MIINVIFINDSACDGVFRKFWLTVLLLIKAIKSSHFVGMWTTFLLWISVDCSLTLDWQIVKFEIVNVTGDQHVCVGSMVTLCCKATGKRISNITWTRVWESGTDSRELPSMDRFYVISNISRSSRGTYRWTASYGIGDPANQTTEVIVGSKL